MRISVLIILLAVGCGPNTSTTPEKPTEADPAATSNSPAGKSKPASPSSPAGSAQDLADTYVSAFQSGNVDAIQGLIYWGDIPVDEAAMNVMFKTRIAKKGTAKLTDIQVADPHEGVFQPDYLSLAPVKMLSAKYEYDGGSGSIRLPIGTVGDKFYFCAVKPVSLSR